MPTKAWDEGWKKIDWGKKDKDMPDYPGSDFLGTISNFDYSKIKKSAYCCGCPSFPYALCGECYRYNYEQQKEDSDEEKESGGRPSGGAGTDERVSSSSITGEVGTASPRGIDRP